MITHNQKFYRGHKEKRRLESNQYYNNLRGAVLQALGGKCNKCGFNDYRALQIDHVHGDGREDRKKFSMNNKSFYKNVMKDFINEGGKYQLLCANCNWIKRYENNETRGRK